MTATPATPSASQPPSPIFRSGLSDGTQRHTQPSHGHAQHAQASLNPLHDRQRVPVTVYDQPGDASRAVAREIAELIQSRARVGKTTVLGLATGSTPVAVYDELIRLHREEGVSFKTVIAFNLDEYWPIQPDALQSYRRFMREHLFDHVDIPANAIHIPDGTLPREQVAAACVRYEEMIREAGGSTCNCSVLAAPGTSDSTSQAADWKAARVSSRWIA